MNTLFLQSEVSDPYALYAEMRAAGPVHFDEENRIWAVYSHAACKRVLASSAARIPAQNPALLPLMNVSSTALVNGFARLANPPRHDARRTAAMRLLGCMREVDAAQLLTHLIEPAGECDWVASVARKLPVLAVLRASAFGKEDTDAILDGISRLTAIMLPDKTSAQIDDINTVAEDILGRAEQHLLHSFPSLTDDSEERRLLAVNLVGLMIQSVDAGRGLLSNALLLALRQPALHEDGEWEKLVAETLRFDPPIQNTRRVLAEEIELGKAVLPEGASVLVVLASANRDENVFDDAHRFKLQRDSQAEHLAFGAGAHACPAHRLAVGLTAAALRAFFGTRRQVELLQEHIAYEPMVNARLPREVRLRYSS